jgi:hypothetical protein
MFGCVKKTLILPCHSTRCVQSIYFSKKNIFFQWCKISKVPTPPPWLATKFNKHFYVEIVWGNKKKLFCFRNNLDFFLGKLFCLQVKTFAKVWNLEMLKMQYSYDSRIRLELNLIMWMHYNESTNKAMNEHLSIAL